MIPSKWHARKGTNMETVKRSAVAGGYRRGKNEQVEQRGVLGHEAIPRGNIMVPACHHTV